MLVSIDGQALFHMAIGLRWTREGPPVVSYLISVHKYVIND